MSQFGRKVVVSVDVYRKVANQNAKVMFEWESENVAIQAEIKKTSAPENNTAVLTIWNISPERAYIISTAEVATFTILAGYEQSTGVDVLFVGDLIGTKPTREGADYGTTFNLATGGAQRRKGQVAVSIKGQTNTSEIIKKALSGSGLSANLPKDFVGTSYGRGFSDVGNRLTIIEKALKGTTYTFTIDDNVLEVVPRRVSPKTLQGANAVVASTIDPVTGKMVLPTSTVVRTGTYWRATISAETGLIGIPQPVMEQQNIGGSGGGVGRVGVHQLAGSPRDQAMQQEVLDRAGVSTESVSETPTRTIQVIAGYDIECLLNPMIHPGGEIEVISDAILGDNTIFKVDSVTHNIETHGKRFTSKAMIKRTL